MWKMPGKWWYVVSPIAQYVTEQALGMCYSCVPEQAETLLSDIVYVKHYSDSSEYNVASGCVCIMYMSPCWQAGVTQA